jgi:hypothetical protein
MNALAFWILAGLTLRWWPLGRAPRRQEYREAMLDGRVRVARWVDTPGASGTVDLPASIAEGIRKPDGIRSVRDKLREGE